MLKKPYKKFYERDFNNYYTIQVADNYYLAIESVLKYRVNPSGKIKELQQGLKLLPLYSPILLTLVSLVQQEQIDVQKVEGLGEEKIYNTVSIPDIRKKIAEMTDQVHEESQFNFKKEIKAPAVRKIMEESNFSLLMRQDLDTFKSVYWIAKSDKFAKLTIHEITTAGRDDEKLMIMNSYFLDKELVEKLLITVQKQQIKEKKEHLKALKKEYKKLKKQNKNNNKGEINNDEETRTN